MRASVLILALAIASPAAAECMPSDLEFRLPITNVRGEFTYVVGEVVNKCAEPAGVELKLELRDAAGKIVGVDDFFLNSARNLEPGKVYAFERPVHARLGMTGFVLTVKQVLRLSR